jgi:hypothetical protein
MRVVRKFCCRERRQCGWLVKWEKRCIAAACGRDNILPARQKQAQLPHVGSETPSRCAVRWTEYPQNECVMQADEKDCNWPFLARHDDPKLCTSSNSIELSHSWEADSSSASQEIPNILWNPKVPCRVYKFLPTLSLSWTRSIQSTLYTCVFQVAPVLQFSPSNPVGSPFHTWLHAKPVSFSLFWSPQL